MNKSIKLIAIIRSLLTPRDKAILCVLLALSVLVSVIEIVSVSLVMPFIAVATNFSLVHNGHYKTVFELFRCSTPIEFIILFGTGLVLFYVLRGLLNIFFIYILHRFSQNRFHIISLKFFTNYLGISYKEFVSKNSAIAWKMIFSDATNLTTILSLFLQLVSELFLVTLMYVMLFFVNWKITLVLTLLLGVLILFVLRPFFKKIAGAGAASGSAWQEITKIFNEAFGNFKLIKIIANEGYMTNRFSSASQSLARSNTVNSTLQAVPRFLLETIGFFILVGVITYVVYCYNDATFVIPIVSIYALVFYRFLPSVTKILTYSNQIVFSHHALEDLEIPSMATTSFSDQRSIEFNHSIVLNAVSFDHYESQQLLKNITMTIAKGEKIGLVGQSGSGKSTLVDLIMGFYEPLKGQILVDGVALCSRSMQSWHQKIGYIPQSVYLFDDTVAANVTFGRPFDEALVIKALVKANIYDFLCTKQGLATRVGEGGVQLSGGQRQRIAIARALYSDPEILILDEATSALDTQTELKIMDEIYNTSDGKTLIIIAHRLTTITQCQKIYEINNGILLPIVQSNERLDVMKALDF